MKTLRFRVLATGRKVTVCLQTKGGGKIRDQYSSEVSMDGTSIGCDAARPQVVQRGSIQRSLLPFR